MSNYTIKDVVTKIFTLINKRFGNVENKSSKTIRSEITKDNVTTALGYTPYTPNEVDNKFSTLETNIDWKESVDTFDDIATTYPNPIDGWTVNVKDTDYTYRYNGTKWVTISANAIPKATNDIDGLLSKEDHEKYEDANKQKHTHDNQSIIDKITQSLLNAWDSAVTHISDTEKHITSDERTNWNSAKTHADSKHAPSDAQANVIETVKVNGTALIPESKAVNITVPTKVSELDNDKNYLSSIPDEYVTNTELEAKGYLTEHQDLSSYAKTSDIPTVPNAGEGLLLVNNSLTTYGVIETLSSTSQLTHKGMYHIWNINESTGCPVSSVGDFHCMLISGYADENGCRYGTLLVSSPRMIDIWSCQIWDYNFLQWIRVSQNDNCIVGRDNTDNTNPWFLVGDFETTYLYTDASATFLVTRDYFGSYNTLKSSGILQIHVRTESELGIHTKQLKWLVSNNDINNMDFTLCTIVEDGLLKVKLYCKMEHSWAGWKFTLLESGGRACNNGKVFNLHNSPNSTGIAELPSGYDVIYSEYSDDRIKLNNKLNSYTVTEVTDFDSFKETGVYHIQFLNGSHQPCYNHGTLYVETNTYTPYQIFIPDADHAFSYKRAWDHSGNNWYSDWFQQRLTDTECTYKRNDWITSGSLVDAISTVISECTNTNITTANFVVTNEVTDRPVGFGWGMVTLHLFTNVNDVSVEYRDSWSNNIKFGIYNTSNGVLLWDDFATKNDISSIIDGSTSIGSANKLTTARAIMTNLESTSYELFDGTGDINPGVAGILPITNGGTGKGTLIESKLNLGIPISIQGGTDSSENTGNEGWYKLFEVSVQIWCTCTLHMSILPSNMIDNPFSPVTIDLILACNNTNTLDPSVYIVGGKADILQKLYVVKNDNSTTDTVEIWYKNSNRFSYINLLVMDVSSRYNSDYALNEITVSPAKNTAVNAITEGKNAYCLFDVIREMPILNNADSGNAATATKLKNARTINGVPFDGTYDITISDRKYAFSGSDSADMSGWYYVAYGAMYINNDACATLSITSTFSRYASGILHLHIRCNSDGISNNSVVTWLSRFGFNKDDVRIALDGNNWYMYIRQTVPQWGRIMVEILSDSGRTVLSSGINLISSTVPESTEPNSHIAVSDSFLPLTGGTLSGDLSILRDTTKSESYFRVGTGDRVGRMTSSATGKFGLYDNTKSAWVGYSDASGNYWKGNADTATKATRADTATEATKLGYDVVFKGSATDNISTALTRSDCESYNYIGISGAINGYKFTQFFPMSAFYEYSDSATGCMVVIANSSNTLIGSVRFNDNDQIIEVNNITLNEIVLFEKAFGTM